MISVLSVDGQVILAATALMPSVMAVMNLATLPRTVPTRFLHQKILLFSWRISAFVHVFIKGSDTPTTRGQITLLLSPQT